MSFICSVCHEALTTNPDDEDLDEAGGAAGGAAAAGQQVDMIVTKCGHLYHLVCITRWFNSQTNPRQECPNCHTPVGNNGYQRIFPAGDEATDREVAAGRNKAQMKAKELEALRLEHEELRTILADRENTLKEEALAHDALKLAHAVTLSELDQVNEQVKKGSQRIRELVESADEFTQDSDTLLQLNLQFSDEVDQLQAQNDLLKEKLKEAEERNTSAPSGLEKAAVEARLLAYSKCKKSLKRLIDELFAGDPCVRNGAVQVKQEPDTDPDESYLNIKTEPEDNALALVSSAGSTPTSSTSDLSATGFEGLEDVGGEGPATLSPDINPPTPVKA